jgi:hypothetical protein
LTERRMHMVPDRLPHATLRCVFGKPWLWLDGYRRCGPSIAIRAIRHTRGIGRSKTPGQPLPSHPLIEPRYGVLPGGSARRQSQMVGAASGSIGPERLETKQRKGVGPA